MKSLTGFQLLVCLGDVDVLKANGVLKVSVDNAQGFSGNLNRVSGIPSPYSMIKS